MELNNQAAQRENVPQNLKNGNNDEEMTIDLIELFYRLLDKIWYIIVASVLGAGIMLAVTMFMMTPKYQATAKLYVLNSSSTSINLSQIQLGNALASDYMQVFNNWHVHEMVKRRLNLDYSYAQMGSMVSVTNLSDTRILSVTVTSTDAQEAKDMALTYAQVAREFIAAKMDMEMPTIFEEPQLATSPSSPSKTKNVMLGFLAGLVLSCGIVVAQFLLDDRIRNAERLEKQLGLATLGMMPVQKEERESRHRHTKSSPRVQKNAPTQSTRQSNANAQPNANAQQPAPDKNGKGKSGK